MDVRVHQTLRVSVAMVTRVIARLWEMPDVVAMLEEWENENARAKPIFEVREAAIGDNAYVQVTMRDRTSDQIYGLDSRDATTEWIEIQKRGRLQRRRSNMAAPYSALIPTATKQPRDCRAHQRLLCRPAI